MCLKDRMRLLALVAAVAGVMLVALAAAPALAQRPGVDQVFPPGIFRSGSLDVQVTGPTDVSFSEPYGYADLTFRASNPRGTETEVLLAVFRDDQWNVIERLGTLAPGESKSFTYQAAFNYTGRTNETDTFGVIGVTRAGYVGRIFTVREDWSAYERSLKSSLSIVGVPLAVLLLVILAIVMAGAFATALKARYEGADEYTLKTLFFPITRARPWAEKIADVIITPFFWVFELFAGAVLVLLILAIVLGDVRPDIGVLIFFVGGVAAIFMPLIFLVATWLADYYQREPFRFVAAMFMWGVMSTLVAFFVNTAALSAIDMFVGSGLALAISAVIVAPVVEETAKGLGLLTLSGHHEYDSTLDGIVYGFAVGMGFAAVENWLYFVVRFSPVTAGGLVPWAYLILYRSLLGSLSHGCFTAATGGVIGFFKARPGLRHHTLLAFLIGLPIAMFLHGTGNLLVILGSVAESAIGLPVPVFDPIYTIAMTAIYIIIGAILQLRLKGRLMRRRPKPEG